MKMRESVNIDICPLPRHSTFFRYRGVRPGFPKCGACELIFDSEKGACELKISKFGGLWTKNFPILGLVSWKFSNWEACELKFGWKLRLWRLNFPNFLKRVSCKLTLLLEMEPLRTTGEAWKEGLQGRTSPYLLSRSVPPCRHKPTYYACLFRLIFSPFLVFGTQAVAYIGLL